MRLRLTEEQQMIQAMAREFAETEIKPIAEEIDREERFRHETVKRMGQLGLLGIAVPDGDHYVLNGRKLFVTSGREASVALVFCQTDRDRGRDGISAFLVEKGTKGFVVTKTEEKLGLRASDTAEFVFEDCRVPAANR